VATFALLAGALAACSGADGSDATPGDIPPATAPSPHDTTPAAQGAWQSPPLSLTAIQDTLRAGGLEHWFEQWLASSGFQQDTVINLYLDGGEWLAEKAAAGEPPVAIDRGTFTTEDDGLRYTPSSGGTNTFQWTITGDQLDLELVSSTEPAYLGVPGEVYQRAIYTVATFNRIPCSGGDLFNYEPDGCKPPSATVQN
jgi:hypothetical protein